MERHVRRFPLVADSESVCTPAKVMSLYNDEDLITNIRGSYQEKDYNDVTRDYDFVKEDTVVATHSKRVQQINEGKSYAELAREEARQNLKQKRQVYVTQDNSKLSTVSSLKTQTQSTPSKKNSKETSELGQLTKHLKQEDYILAELPITYKEPENNVASKPKKNSYDFLKRSQIYNKEARQTQRERKIAQELNLTRFEDASFS